jgi:CSLREA domain-containing protein
MSGLNFQILILICVMLISGVVGVYGATYTVTKTADTNDGICDSDCSLREAIAVANGTAANDTINFNIPTGDAGCTGGVCVITLSSQLTINSASSSGTLTITNANGGKNIEVAGSNMNRVLLVLSGGNLNINSLTLRNGFGVGGGIANYGIATINNSTIRNNGCPGAGGGIANYGTATIINTTISNNSAAFGGGGIFNDSNSAAIITIINSTISNNSATAQGGGIDNDGTVTIINSTVSNNITSNLAGGIYNSGTFNARNTIIANNITGGFGPDFNGTLTSQGNNFIENISGITSTLDSSDIIGLDPLLAPLGYYGGFTWTRPLLTNSKAGESGNNCVTTASGCGTNDPPIAINTDQRGASRTSSTVDIGAYEDDSTYVAGLPNGFQSQAYSFQITSNNESCTMSMTGLPLGLSLQQSGTAYNITGTPTQTGNFTPQLTITCGTNQATVNYSMVINTPTAGGVTISGRVYATGGGRGLLGATVVLTDMNGNERTTLSSTFGYFRFDDVRAGEAYILSVRSRRYHYLPQYFFVGENISDIGFYPVASNPSAASPPATNPATVAPTQAPEQQPPGRPGQNLLQKPGRIETKSEMKTLRGGYKQWN